MKYKYCNMLEKVVEEKDCKNCKSKDLHTRFFKTCKNAIYKKKCPKCKNVFD